MKISILCSDAAHPVFLRLQQWQQQRKAQHDIELVTARSQLTGGDLLFLVSCSEIIKRDVRDRYRATLVLHASPVPVGRGWSPHLWQILQGAGSITVTLLAAEDAVDTGDIWAQREFPLRGDELWDEINDLLFAAELELLSFAVDHLEQIVPRKQADQGGTYFRKRNPEDSRLDPHKTIADQFDLLRICDPMRFPAFFEYRGAKYVVQLRKEQPHE